MKGATQKVTGPSRSSFYLLLLLLLLLMLLLLFPFSFSFVHLISHAMYIFVIFIYTDGYEHQDTRKKRNACSAYARLCGRIWGRLCVTLCVSYQSSEYPWSKSTKRKKSVRKKKLRWTNVSKCACVWSEIEGSCHLVTIWGA